ncbi:MAG: diacylglycerol kinase [Gammaproteobacteria bacterium]|nr:diacylglycerol kinase [Gammaproteobacteria bacterium]
MNADAPEPPTGKPARTGLARIRHALGYSLAGLRAAWRHEAAFRQEIALVVLLAPLGLWLGQNGVERALLLGVLGLVVVCELVNSAVEAAIDRHGPEHHELAGRAKDAGSAAVLVAIVVACLTWLLVLAG